MVHVLIIGAAGMIGRKLTQRLAREGKLAGRQITALSLVDITQPEKPAGFGGSCRWRPSTSPIRRPSPRASPRAPTSFSILQRSFPVRPRRISTRAIASISTGRGTCSKRSAGRERRRRIGRALVFTSSIAVFGAPFPEPIGDEFFTTPLTSYGTQKAISRTAHCRLFTPRLPRRHQHPLADHLHQARQAQQGGVGLFLEYPARAARRPGGRAAGGGRCAPLACEPARRRRLSRPRGGRSIWRRWVRGGR